MSDISGSSDEVEKRTFDPLEDIPAPLAAAIRDKNREIEDQEEERRSDGCSFLEVYETAERPCLCAVVGTV